ncbi:NTP transferase domain-containing protein [Marinactinospora thermotolerans]|uniref:MobA-like NTP transferase domain-containing protein n=1 Tax=Marinactinospora thermotolerans DSM 45154 TaxID=1122192 RepID=A0A1T4SCF2_9ACTN|nr:NTP transferase domain-containing protein [Marinactinospora thermotolerans]SKA25837.1 MobA-like NTP transferase domain-containing protein [Marinactinospora thermotolerans DSM 45154]
MDNAPRPAPVRVAAVLVTPDTGALPPPGIDPDVYALALVEDTYEVAAGLTGCEPVVVVWRRPRITDRVAELTWPGTTVADVDGPQPLRAALEAVEGRGAEQAVIVAADAPDLPPLLIGKLLRGLGSAELAVCPAEGGGLVALACRLPPPPWQQGADLDAPDALATLARARPTRRALSVAPGWHRLRAPADIDRLDQGLEGWESTRAVLASGTVNRPPG